MTLAVTAIAVPMQTKETRGQFPVSLGDVEKMGRGTNPRPWPRPHRFAMICGTETVLSPGHGPQYSAEP